MTDEASKVSVNSSSFLSFLIVPSDLLANCFGSRVGNFIFTGFAGTNILFLLPLYIFILYLGHRRQRQHGSASANSCDFVTLHIAVMEIICVLASIVYCIGVYAYRLRMILVATNVFLTTVCAVMLFHNIICTDCYLAVVHPVTYLHMKNGRGARIRNVMIWSVWPLSCAKLSIIALNSLDVLLIMYVTEQTLSLVFVSFCSISVLRALKRGGPGEGSRDKERVDQLKQRALHTIMAVTGTLLLRLGGSVVCAAIYISPLIGKSDQCVAIFAGYWFCLPSSLAAPLLFLHRVGKMPFCKNNSESGQGST